MKRFLVRAVINALALGVATWLVSGIYLRSSQWLTQAATLLLVAVVFGVINAILKPIIKVLGCAFYVLTLGLFALVVNALLLWLTSWLADKWDLPWHVNGFWAAFWGAIIVSVVSWIIGLATTADDK
jgi:putative membrane protein